MPAAASNHHCSVVAVEGHGVLIEGSSGSGKTSLALGLVDTARARGIEAALVCDDQALLARLDGRLVASAPPAIAGMAELRGYGITRVAHRPCCTVAVVGRIGADRRLARMADAERTELMGVDLPLVRLPRRHEQQAIRIILAWLAEHRAAAEP